MADWEFNIWIGGQPLATSIREEDTVKLRSYKRPQWVTAALPKIAIGFEKAYIQVNLNGKQVAVVDAKRWLQSEDSDPPDWEQYFSEMMEEQRYYEREKVRAQARKKEDNATT